MTLINPKQSSPRRKLLRRIITIGISIFLFTVIALVLSQDAPVPGAPGTQVSRIIGDHFFDFAEWLGEAWLEKLGLLAVPAADYLTDAQRSQLVLNQMQRLNDWAALDQQVRQAFADPANKDPDASTRDLRARRDALRA